MLDAFAGVITDATHGNLGGGSLHRVATADMSGFMSGADKAKLDTLSTATAWDFDEGASSTAYASGTIDFDEGTSA